MHLQGRMLRGCLAGEGSGGPVSGVEAAGLGAASGFGAFEAFLMLLMAVAWCYSKVTGSIVVQVSCYLLQGVSSNG